MIHVNIPIRLKTVINASQSALIPTVMDLILVDGDGYTEYYVGGAGHSPSYQAPIPDTSVPEDPDNSIPGFFHFTKSFPTPGKWQVILASGSASVYVAKYTYFVTVQQSETEINNESFWDYF